MLSQQFDDKVHQVNYTAITHIMIDALQESELQDVMFELRVSELFAILGISL